jgi:hypothetical protein
MGTRDSAAGSWHPPLQIVCHPSQLTTLLTPPFCCCPQIIAKASKSLAKDKPLGTGELNMVQVSRGRPCCMRLPSRL